MPDPDDDALPRIAWDNALARAHLEASSAAPGHDAAFCCDGTLHRSWMPVGGGTHTLTATWDAPQTLTCWALYGHDLGQRGGRIRVEVDLGAGWRPFADEVAPAGSACLYRVVAAPVTTRRARIVVTAATAPRLAALFLGDDLVCSRGLQPGWTDPFLGQKQIVVPARSRSGLPLPGLVEDEYAEGQITLHDVELAWARERWAPFARFAQTGGFFLRWHPDAAPAYGSGAQIEEAACTRAGHVTVGLSCRLETA